MDVRNFKWQSDKYCKNVPRAEDEKIKGQRSEEKGFYKTVCDWDVQEINENHRENDPTPLDIEGIVDEIKINNIKLKPLVHTCRQDLKKFKSVIISLCVHI